jgi:hypothetical protein
LIPQMAAELEAGFFFYAGVEVSDAP